MTWPTPGDIEAGARVAAKAAEERRLEEENAEDASRE